MRLVPCVGLTVLSLLLVQTMRQAEERRQNLRGKSSAVSREGGGGGGGGGSDRKTNRTTMMLLLVVVLFLVTEFPQGVVVSCRKLPQCAASAPKAPRASCRRASSTC